MTAFTIYLWVVACTTALLMFEVTMARRYISILTKDPMPYWSCRSIVGVMVVSAVPPVGWLIAVAVYRRRMQVQRYIIELFEEEQKYGSAHNYRR